MSCPSDWAKVATSIPEAACLPSNSLLAVPDYNKHHQHWFYEYEEKEEKKIISRNLILMFQWNFYKKRNVTIPYKVSPFPETHSNWRLSNQTLGCVPPL